jgi:hypothetical protein
MELGLEPELEPEPELQPEPEPEPASPGPASVCIKSVQFDAEHSVDVVASHARERRSDAHRLARRHRSPLLATVGCRRDQQ